MEKTDAILVLGHRLNPDNTPSEDLISRIDTAVACWKETGAPVIMPCGGITRDRTRSEAEVMRELLLERGVPENVIRMEDKSRTTSENIINAVDLLGPGANVALVTSDYHVEHALYECERYGLRAYGVPAPTLDAERRQKAMEKSREIMAFIKECVAKGLDPQEEMHKRFRKMREEAEKAGKPLEF